MSRTSTRVRAASLPPSACPPRVRSARVGMRGRVVPASQIRWARGRLGATHRPSRVGCAPAARVRGFGAPGRIDASRSGAKPILSPGTVGVAQSRVVWESRRVAQESRRVRDAGIAQSRLRPADSRCLLRVVRWSDTPHGKRASGLISYVLSVPVVALLYKPVPVVSTQI
ncbi:hypothetical protein C8R43DRAFT_1018564 [Mycena crocata]|nr:hypothetical protein C8R43DRAFT_1018564 [Mycena crocata]